MYRVPFKWFVLPVAGLMLKCWPPYKLVGKLVLPSNKPTILLPTNLLHVPDRTAEPLQGIHVDVYTYMSTGVCT